MKSTGKSLDHFRRSTRLERDCTAAGISGYIPTPRCLELIRQLVESLSTRDYKAFSITGPFGSGKSSFAVFLSALLADSSLESNLAAMELLDRDAPDLAVILQKARQCLIPDGKGFLLARVTADRSPLVQILTEALTSALQGNTLPETIRVEALAMLDTERPDEKVIVKVVKQLCAHRPLLICIDEFGKTLEWFSEHKAKAGDLYLLQQLIEQSVSQKGFPLILVTLQHLAFDDYAADAAALRQREWAKIQGRFRDFPFTDSSHSTSFLMSRFLETLEKAPPSDLTDIIEGSAAHGLTGLLQGPIDQFAPLHPVTALLLPELCSKYGQHERSLFKFLGSEDEGALHWLIAEGRLSAGWVMPWHLYDYFLVSTGGACAMPSLAQRWIEIQTRIRDAIGLSDFELTILKTVAIFNLCSSSGPLRASEPLLAWMLSNKGSVKYNFSEAFSQLQSAGFLTYRDQVDEYRLWRGSDFNLGEQIRLLMANQRDVALDHLLGEAITLNPLIASRHSQQRHVVRLFQQVFASQKTDLSELSPSFVDPDGLLVWWLGDQLPKSLILPEWASSVLVLSLDRLKDLHQLVSYANAYKTLLESGILPADDWVARQEAQERYSLSQKKLYEKIIPLMQLEPESKIRVIRPSDFHVDISHQYKSLPSLLSAICDSVYSQTPTLPNEMLARRELTSQGAKARRLLIEAIGEKNNQPLCGLSGGFGPERSMFEAVMALHGLYRDAKGLCYPYAQSDLTQAYRAIDSFFRQAKGLRRNLADLWKILKAPPFGLKDGPIPVLVAHYLFLHDDEVGIYEDGCFTPSVDSALVERLSKNPQTFSSSSFILQKKQKIFASKLIEELQLPLPSKLTILYVVKQILRQARRWPNHSRSTQQLTLNARRLRKALLAAKEPDQLLFFDMPRSVGFDSFDSAPVDDVVNAIVTNIREVDQRFRLTLQEMEEALANALNSGLGSLRSDLAVRAERIKDQILEPRLRAFVLALSDRETPSKGDWLQRVGLSLLGRAPTDWIDVDVQHFNIALKELAPSFRRIEAMHFQQQSLAHSGFTAVRVGITTADGYDNQEVVSIPHEHGSELADFVSQLRVEAKQRFGPEGPVYALAQWARLELCNEAGNPIQSARKSPNLIDMDSSAHG